MPAVSLLPEAYCVCLMHACKHAAKAVNGLLLGKVEAEDKLTIVRAMPLFHSSFALAPMLEAALMLADEFCKTEKLQIVGYYQANELSGDMDLGPFGRKIAEKIKGQFARAAVLMVDGSKTSASESDLCLQLLGTDGKPSSQTLTLRDASKAMAFLEQSLSRGAQQQVVDFDAHLDDPSKDWLNSGVVCA